MIPSPPEIRVLTNHLGYRPGHGRKLVVVPYTVRARQIFGSPIFQVIEQNELSKYPLDDPRQQDNVFVASMQEVRDDFGHWLVGDFSTVTRPGVYQAFVGTAPGVPFVIREDVYARLLPPLLTYMRVQSCGRDAPGWHPACHLDDGYLPESDAYIEAAGGWHDAGDFRKWGSSTSMNGIALLLAERLLQDRHQQMGVEPGTCLHEACQGLHYFLGVQDPASGGVYHNVGGGGESVHDNLDCRYTDNVPRSGDERRIHAGFVTPPGKMTTLFALYASALRERDAALSQRCLDAARNSHAHDLRQEVDDATHLQWRAWALAELAALSGEADERAAAVACLDRLLELQVVEPIGEMGLHGLFHHDRNRTGFHHKHVGADFPPWVLGRFLELWPEDARAEAWRRALARWVDGYCLPMIERNVFGLLPYVVYPEPPAQADDNRYRPLGGGPCFRYFLKGQRGMSNARFALSAAALASCAGALDRPELADHGYRLLEWVLGANPYQLSMFVGLGPQQMSPFSPLMGAIPGGICCGLGSNREDVPDLQFHPWAAPPEHAEYYGYNSSQFLWALCALQRVTPRQARDP